MNCWTDRYIQIDECAYIEVNTLIEKTTVFHTHIMMSFMQEKKERKMKSEPERQTGKKVVPN